MFNIFIQGQLHSPELRVLKLECSLLHWFLVSSKIPSKGTFLPIMCLVLGTGTQGSALLLKSNWKWLKNMLDKKLYGFPASRKLMTGWNQ